MNKNQTDQGPLMFIQSTKNISKLQAKNQEVYDSRFPNKHMKKPNKEESKNFIKLQRSIKMYEKGHPIVLKLIRKNNQTIEVIPYQLEDEILFCIKDSQKITIPLSQIQEIMIIRI